MSLERIVARGHADVPLEALDAPAVDGLRCRAVVGAARDVLAEAVQAERLHARDILYAPDALAAAGGLTGTISDEDERAVQERVAGVGARLEELWARARAEGMSPLRAAHGMVAARLDPRGIRTT